MINDFTTLSASDVVHVVTNYGADCGPYTVTKANKVKVELTNSQGHTYVFSVKTRRQLGVPGNRYTYNYLITVEDAEFMAAAKARKRAQNACWNKIKQAADQESVTDLKAALEELAAL